ncbi:MAG: O-antigen ligase family protein [Syntrophales bacterium]|nr:O-antigen ligase family protein [Syntrophales bacterium]
MTGSETRSVPIVLALIVLLALASAIVTAKISIALSAVVVIGLIIAIFSFTNPEFGLYVLVVAMLLSPQVGLPGAEGEMVRGRGITLRVDDFLLAIIGLTWFFKTAIQKELGLFLRTPLNIPIAIYFIICVSSTILGYMMGRVKGTAGIFFLLKYFEYYIVYFMAVNHLREEKQIKRFVATMIVVCLLVSLNALTYMYQGQRASAPFEGSHGEPNTLGGYLILMIAIMIGLFLHWGTAKQKFYLLVVLFFSFVALAATLSRSSWIALGPMSLALIYFSEKEMRKWILLGIIAFFLSLPFVTPKSVQERLLFTITQPREQGQLEIAGTRVDTSTSARLMSMKIVLTRDFLKQPILGYGVTGYSFLDAQYARVLAESGLLGFLAFINLLWRIYRNAKATLKETVNPFYKGLTLGYLVGFFGLLTHGIGANTFIIVRIMEPFWFLTAMVIMIPRIEAGEFAKTERTP